MDNIKQKESDGKNWKALSFKNFVKFRQDHAKSRRAYEKKI